MRPNWSTDGQEHKAIEDRHNLPDRLVFSQPLGRQHFSTSGGDQAKPGNQKFAAHDDDHGPSGNTSKGDQTDEGGHRHDFVHERIHQFSEISDQLELSSDVSVGVVSDAARDKQTQSQQFRTGKVETQRNHERQRQKQAKNGELIGKIHAI